MLEKTENMLVNLPLYEGNTREELEHAFAYLEKMGSEAYHLSFADIVTYTGNIDALENVQKLFKRFFEQREEQLKDDVIDTHWGTGDMESEVWAAIQLAVEQYDEREVAA